jgi:hypothetical protein
MLRCRADAADVGDADAATIGFVISSMMKIFENAWPEQAATSSALRFRCCL